MVVELNFRLVRAKGGAAKENGSPRLITGRDAQAKFSL